MNAQPLSVVLLLASLGLCLVDGWAVGRRGPQTASGFYTEPQLLKFLLKVFSGLTSEKLVFIAADGQVFSFGSGDRRGVAVKLTDVSRALALKGQSLRTVTNVIHNHQPGEDFSRADLVLCEQLRKLGFAGEFQLFYPRTGRIITLKRRNHARA